MAWDLTDFIVFGVLLGGIGITYKIVTWHSHSGRYRAAVGVALASTFLLLWVNGAVGIIGDENNDANMMYVGVLALGAIGAMIARFKPTGMERTMYALAISHALITLITLRGDLGSAAPIWPWDILILNGTFAALWLLSAWLFRRAVP